MLSFSDLTLEEDVGAYKPLKRKDENYDYFKKTVNVNNKRLTFTFARDKNTNILYPKKKEEKSLNA